MARRRLALQDRPPREADLTRGDFLGAADLQARHVPFAFAVCVAMASISGGDRQS